MSTNMIDDLVALIATAVETVYDDNLIPKPDQFDANTVIVGTGTDLDSISVVMLVADVERRLDEQMGLSLVIADETGLLDPTGPFRTIGTFADYLAKKLT